MFIDTKTYVILKDELLLTFFYQWLWLFYPFYWSCLIVCSSGFVWWFMRLIFSSLCSSCCNIHLLNKFILLFSSYAGSTRWFPRLFVHHYLKYLTIMVNMVVSLFLVWWWFFFSGHWGIYFLFFLFPSFGSSGCSQCLLVAWFLDLIYNPRVLSISAGYMFLSCTALIFSSFFLFVHCFNCLLPLSAAVSGSSLRLFQCLVLFEFSLPLFCSLYT